MKYKKNQNIFQLCKVYFSLSAFIFNLFSWVSWVFFVFIATGSLLILANKDYHMLVILQYISSADVSEMFLTCLVFSI